MNPANGLGNNSSLNGSGNGFPMRGTGNTIYAQVGVAFGNSILSENGKLQPFLATQISNFQALNEPMAMVEGGINWYINGDHQSKLSLNYQNRPIFVSNTIGEASVSHYRGMAQIQLQVGF